MNLEKFRSVVPEKGQPRGTVRFITDDEVEIAETLPLGIGHHLNGLIGRKDDGTPLCT